MSHFLFGVSVGLLVISFVVLMTGGEQLLSLVLFALANIYLCSAMIVKALGK